LLVSEEDKFRFEEARLRDHLFCPFQYELCHFRNIQGRSPIMGKGLLGDTELMKCLRRVNLDAFWSREPTTIKQNLGKVNWSLHITHKMGMRDPPMPKLGPWKLVDEFGAAAATIMVKHSLDLGVTETTVQFETVRKMKPAFVNLYQASVENESSVVIRGKDGKKHLIMRVPIYHGWYDRAQVGKHHRMGDKVVQDYRLSHQVVVALEAGLENEWEAARDNAGNRLEIAQLAYFILLDYDRALRGE
jgi:hypothetical protein